MQRRDLASRALEAMSLACLTDFTDALEWSQTTRGIALAVVENFDEAESLVEELERRTSTR